MADQWIGQWVADSSAAMSECLTGQQLALVSFFLPQMRKSWTSLLIEHPYRLHISSRARSFVWGLFFTEAPADFFYRTRKPQLHFLKCDQYQFFHLLYVYHHSKSLDPFCSKHVLVAHCCLHLTRLQVTKPTQKHSVKQRKHQTLGSFTAEGGWGCPGCIQSLTPMKWSTPWPIDGQDSGMVEYNHAVKPPLSSQVC